MGSNRGRHGGRKECDERGWFARKTTWPLLSFVQLFDVPLQVNTVTLFRACCEFREHTLRNEASEEDSINKWRAIEIVHSFNASHPSGSCHDSDNRTWGPVSRSPTFLTLLDAKTCALLIAIHVEMAALLIFVPFRSVCFSCRNNFYLRQKLVFKKISLVV